MPTIRVFEYIQQLDAFVPTDEYRRIAERLGLAEWNPVVWIGRLFALDNDYGEHWFDNWEERESMELEAGKLGMRSDELLIVVPDRFKNDEDGPCHQAELRKQFWTDVLKSLELNFDTLFGAARLLNARAKELDADGFIEDLESRIAAIRTTHGREARKKPTAPSRPKKKNFTPKQGQYLAFIHLYSKIHRRPPAETDIQHYFEVSPPSIHQMILTLEKRGLIKKKPRQARTIRVLVPPEDLPTLE